MAMTSAGLASAINTQVQSISGINIINVTEMQNYHLALATAIVTYIQSNAVVIQGPDSAGDTEVPGVVT